MTVQGYWKLLKSGVAHGHNVQGCKAAEKPHKVQKCFFVVVVFFQWSPGSALVAAFHLFAVDY